MIEFFCILYFGILRRKKDPGKYIIACTMLSILFSFYIPISVYLSISRSFKIAFMVSRQSNGVTQAFYSCIFIYLFMFISNYLSIFLSRCGSYYFNWPVSCRSLFFLHLIYLSVYQGVGGTVGGRRQAADLRHFHPGQAVKARYSSPSNHEASS